MKKGIKLFGTFLFVICVAMVRVNATNLTSGITITENLGIVDFEKSYDSTNDINEIKAIITVDETLINGVLNQKPGHAGVGGEASLGLYFFGIDLPIEGSSFYKNFKWYQASDNITSIKSAVDGAVDSDTPSGNRKFWAPGIYVQYFDGTQWKTAPGYGTGTVSIRENLVSLLGGAELKYGENFRFVIYTNFMLMIEWARDDGRGPVNREYVSLSYDVRFPVMANFDDANGTTAYYPSLQEALESGSKDIVINNDLPISDDVEIPADTLVKIKPNVSLVLSQGVNFTNNGTVDNEGIIDSTNGTFTNNGDFSNLNGGKVIGEDGRDEYFVKVKDSSHGTVTSDKVRVAFGDEVKLTINPDEGYELDTIKVINLSDDSEVTLTNYMFEMPKSDVEVIATFKALPPTPDTYDGILLYVVIGSISLLGLILGLVSLKKRMN